MINEIKVNTTRLGTDAEKVNDYMRKIETAVNKIEESMKRIDGKWDGDASKAFNTAMKNDIKEIKEIIKNLEEIYNYESNAKKKYEICEGKVADLVAQIKV